MWTEPLDGVSVSALVFAIGVTLACALTYFLVASKWRLLCELRKILVVTLAVMIPVSALAILAYFVLE